MGGARLDRGDGIDLWGGAMGSATPVGSRRWDWFKGAHHRGARNWLDRARGLIQGGMRHSLDRGDAIASWGHAMGARNTGWIGAMGLIYGGVRNWQERGDGIDSLGLAMGARDSGWNGAMGLIYGAVRHWLERVDGIDSWGSPWGHATLAGSGWWDWFMGVCHGGLQHGRGDWIDLWGCLMGVRDWIGVMGLIGGVAPWGCVTLAGSGRWDWFMGACDIGWIWAMGLIHGGTPWGHATLAGSGWWDWIIGARNGVSPPWLDRGDGFDWWELETLAGPGRCYWFMGTRHGGTRLDRRDWIDLRGHAMGMRHWLDVGNGIELWGCAIMARDWIGWWNWFVGESNGSVMVARDTGWIGAMGLIHGDVPNDKVLYGCWIWVTIPCVLMSGVEVSAQSVFG